MTGPRIGIIQTAFLGDVVLTLPLAEAIKRALPNAEVTFVGIPQTANLVEHHPFIDRRLVFDKRGHHRGLAGLRRFAQRLRGLTIVLLPHRSLRSAAAAFLAEIPVRVGFDTSAGAFLLTHTVPYRRAHEVERNLDLLRALHIPAQPLPPRIYPDGNDRTVVDSVVEGRYPRPWVAIAPGSIWPTKRWPVERFATLVRLLQRRLGATIVLVGGPDDEGLAAQLVRQSSRAVINAVGRLTPRQSAELLGRCDVAVSNDSAPAHLAAAMSTPVVALFGPTVTDFGFAPYGERHRIVERRLPCRPCSWHGGQRCPLGTFDCMRFISPDDVLEKVEEVLFDHGAGIAGKRPLEPNTAEVG